MVQVDWHIIDADEALSRLDTSAKDSFRIFVKHYFHILNVRFWPKADIINTLVVLPLNGDLRKHLGIGIVRGTIKADSS